MKKAVIYTRVSTEEQSKEGVSLDNQLEKCRLQAQLNDYQVIREIQDAGKSAKNLKREGIREVINLAEKKSIEAIVIYKLDRLTRNVSDLNRLIELFIKKNVELISVQDSLNTATASGRMVINVLGTISQWERETIAERTRDALQYKKTNGHKYSGIIPYGYLLIGNQLIDNPEEQTVILQITKLRESLSFQKIADRLNKLNIPTRLGGAWTKQSAQKIYLDNQKKISLEKAA